MAAYFLKLGATGFGGPIALLAYMERDLVAERRWIDADTYRQGIALAQLAPGPLAMQVAAYVGYICRGWLGGLVAMSALTLPGVIIALLAATGYAYWHNQPWVISAMAGMRPVLLALIAVSAWRLARRSLPAMVSVVLAVALGLGLTLLMGTLSLWTVLLGGVVVLLGHVGWGRPATASLFIGSLLWLKPAAALAAIPLSARLLAMATTFGGASLVVYGSGLAIVPSLFDTVVTRYHWLSAAAFTDALAIGFVTPGPVSLSVTFMGYMGAGLAGALVATVALYAPVYLFVLILGPVAHRLTSHQAIRLFVAGLTAAAIGGIVASVGLLSLEWQWHWTQLVLGILALVVLLLRPRLPVPVPLGVAAGVGLVLGYH